MKKLLLAIALVGLSVGTVHARFVLPAKVTFGGIAVAPTTVGSTVVTTVSGTVASVRPLSPS